MILLFILTEGKSIKHLSLNYPCNTSTCNTSSSFSSETKTMLIVVFTSIYYLKLVYQKDLKLDTASKLTFGLLYHIQTIL